MLLHISEDVFFKGVEHAINPTRATTTFLFFIPPTTAILVDPWISSLCLAVLSTCSIFQSQPIGVALVLVIFLPSARSIFSLGQPPSWKDPSLMDLLEPPVAWIQRDSDPLGDRFPSLQVSFHPSCCCPSAFHPDCVAALLSFLFLHPGGIGSSVLILLSLELTNEQESPMGRKPDLQCISITHTSNPVRRPGGCSRWLPDFWWSRMCGHSCQCAARPAFHLSPLRVLRRGVQQFLIVGQASQKIILKNIFFMKSL